MISCFSRRERLARSIAPSWTTRMCGQRSVPIGARAFFWCGILPTKQLGGVGLMQNATRAKPNAFHFRRQVVILQRAGAGSSERQFKAPWVFLVLSYEQSWPFQQFQMYHFISYPTWKSLKETVASPGVGASIRHCKGLWHWKSWSWSSVGANDTNSRFDRQGFGERCQAKRHATLHTSRSVVKRHLLYFVDIWVRNMWGVERWATQPRRQRVGLLA